jgi:hypothetical protein
MEKNRTLAKCTALLVIITFIVALASCGTLMHPERRGQKDGKIDVGIAVLDGLGLLLFIIPGVIAFAVDFSTGAIYLPPRSSKLTFSPEDLKHAEIMRVDPNNLTSSEVELLISKKIDQKINLDSPETKVAKVISNKTPVWGSIGEVLTAEELTVFKNKNS